MAKPRITRDRDPAWVALGQAIVHRRVELGMRSRDALAERAELTSKTIGEIERGDRTSYEASTLAAIEQALEWPAGRIRSLLTRSRQTDPSPQTLMDETTRAVSEYFAARMPPGGDLDGMLAKVMTEWPESGGGKRRPVVSHAGGDLAELRREMLERFDRVDAALAALQEILSRR